MQAVTGEQSTFFREHYEVAWRIRWQWMKEFIANGARHPLTVIRNFAAHERRNTLGFDDALQAYVWRPRFPEHPGQELMPSGTPPFRDSSLRGHPLKVPFHVGAHYSDFIVDFVATHGPFDLVVELGCGYGRNLFEIAYSGLPLNSRLVGGELTQSGVEAANTIAALDPGLDLTVYPFDFLAPALGQIQPGQRTLVYTCHAVEQVHRIDAKAFEVMCGLGQEVVGVHLEPFGFQVQPELGPITQTHRSNFLKAQWNVNLISALQAAQSRGQIQLDYLATEIFFPSDPTNPGSLAVWHKLEAKGRP